MSEVGDLSFVVDDGVLSDPWEIERSTGSWKQGGWVTVPSLIPGWGVISVATADDVEMVPEGDPISGAMVFHSQERPFLTQMDQQKFGEKGYGQVIQHVSDIFIFANQKWRVMWVSPYPQHNFWKAIAVRMQGN